MSTSGESRKPGSRRASLITVGDVIDGSTVTGVRPGPGFHTVIVTAGRSTWTFGRDQRVRVGS